MVNCSNAAAGVDHGELIAINGDENAKYDNSSDREEDVGDGGGAGDEVIKLSRCVFARQMFYLTNEILRWWRGMGMLMVRARKTLWAFDPGQHYREIGNYIML